MAKWCKLLFGQFFQGLKFHKSIKFAEFITSKINYVVERLPFSLKMSQSRLISKVLVSVKIKNKNYTWRCEVYCYRITGYFRSRNFRRTLDKLNFEVFIFETVAELENILTCTILYAP